MSEEKIKRSRGVYFLFLILTIILGLSSRKFPEVFPKFFSEYAGDTLYAVMIFLLTGFIRPQLQTFRVALFSLLFCFLIEISQTVHFEWLDEIRRYRIGGLILGYGFLWRDLVCYTLGICLAAPIEIVFFRIYK